MSRRSWRCRRRISEFVAEARLNCSGARQRPSPEAVLCKVKRMSEATSHKTRTLWLCGILHAFTHLYQVALVPLYLLIQQDLKLSSVSAAPLLVSAMGLAYSLPSYAMGHLADHASRKKL